MCAGDGGGDRNLFVRKGGAGQKKDWETLI